ncbi:MAG TPA: hypothetical protein VG013_15590 [Gemmataceae bacterium]|jgi:hypothetical protein|nr:hypothetical protein [Gemmataceae bacterium]
MGILGKILAILNVLTAALFVYLAAADWGKRQSWSYAVWRFDRANHGIPVDSEERDPTEGKKLVDEWAKLLPDLFGAVGPAVATQEDEVKRVRDQFQGDIERETAEAAKRQKLSDLLVPLARTGPERDAVRQAIATAKMDVLLGADGPFQKAFDRALAEKNSAGKPRNPDERREAIAHLLFNLGQKDATARESWDKRLLVVIGLKAFADEASRQAQALHGMTQRVKLAMADDLAAFETQHNARVRELRVLDRRLTDAQAQFTDLAEQHEKHQHLVNDRADERDKLKQQLEDARALAQNALKKQADVEEHLFKAQIEVDNGQKQNERLEGEIRGLEKVEP